MAPLTAMKKSLIGLIDVTDTDCFADMCSAPLIYMFDPKPLPDVLHIACTHTDIYIPCLESCMWEAFKNLQ